MLLVFTISISISSCKKDTNFLDRREVVNYVDANNLKLWFNQTPAILIGNKGSWFNTLTPNWEKVQRFENDLENVYEIDLNNPDHIFTAASEIDVKRMETFERKSLFKLIVFENKLDKKLNAAIMEMVAFEGNTIALAQLHYKNYKTFSGAVNYYELNGQLANGWLYKEGEIIAKTGKNMELSGLSFDNSLSSAKGKVMLAQANLVECGSISVPHWRETCNTVGGDTGDGWAYDAGLVVTTCRWEIYHTTEIIYCPVSDGGGASGGGYTGGSSGGSTGTTNDPADDPCAKAKALNENTNYKNETNNLKNKVDDITLKKEVGYIKKVGSPSSYTEPSGTGLVFPIPQLSELTDNSLEYIMHTHYQDSTALSTFGYSDFIAFVEFLGSNKISNVNTFNIGATTKYATYSLILKNWSKFNNYLQSTIRSLQPSIELYQTFNAIETGVHELNSGAVNESHLLKILKDSGISLLKKDPMTGNFKVLKVDTNGNVSFVDCPGDSNIE